MATFNNNQHDSFFLNGPQMALSAIERYRLSGQGLTEVEDFADFQKDQLDQAFKNLRVGIPGIPAVTGPDGTVLVPEVQAIQPCIISAKCSLRLRVASEAYHYYRSILRSRTPSNMNYTQVLRAFYVEYEALITLSKKDSPDVPTLSKHNTPIRWTESFRDCLYRTYGVRKCPLLYVIRESAAVPDEATDPLLPNKAFGQSGSVVEELILRLTHDDPLFRSDNAAVYSMLEEATRGTVYGPTIKPYARRKDGRAAWQAMMASHAGQDKWETLQKEKLRTMMTTKWNGKQYGLEKFTGIHRSCFVNLEEAAQHVNFQLPTEHSRVGYLIDNIVNSDPDLRAAIANIRMDINSMRSDFEKAVAALLPVCPFAKHRQSLNPTRPQISDTTLQGKGQSTTGVDLRWHTQEEYKKLSKEQRQELYRWQSTKDGREKIKKDKAASGIVSRSAKSRKKLRAKIDSLEAQLKDSGPTLEEISACIATATAAAAPPVPRPPTPPPVTARNQGIAMAVQRILKRKRDE